MSEEEIFNNNIGLAHKVANKYYINYKEEFEDIMQIAYIGLLKAIRTYKGKEYMFSTYASCCIFNEINNYIRKVEKIKINNISLNTKIYKNLTFEDMLIEKKDFVEILEEKENIKNLLRIEKEEINRLNERDKKIYFYSKTNLTQKEIAKLVHLSRQWVNVIANRINKRILQRYKEECI